MPSSQRWAEQRQQKTLCTDVIVPMLLLPLLARLLLLLRHHWHAAGKLMHARDAGRMLHVRH